MTRRFRCAVCRGFRRLPSGAALVLLLALLKDVATVSVQVIDSKFGWMIGAFDTATRTRGRRSRRAGC